MLEQAIAAMAAERGSGRDLAVASASATVEASAGLDSVNAGACPAHGRWSSVTSRFWELLEEFLARPRSRARDMATRFGLFDFRGTPKFQLAALRPASEPDSEDFSEVKIPGRNFQSQ